MAENVVLVTESGKTIGQCEKMLAHQTGQLHRAFSLVIVRKTPTGYQHLMQRRAWHKYHSGGLWSNACCSHPRPEETVQQAVQRRVSEEIGITQSLHLISLPPLLYRAELDNGLTEFEYDHIFVCEDDITHMQPNGNEIDQLQWVDEQVLENQIRVNPSFYTAWFPMVFRRIQACLPAPARTA